MMDLKNVVQSVTVMEGESNGKIAPSFMCYAQDEVR